MRPIFVYGTLKRGYGNHHLLETAEFVGCDQAPGIVYGGHGAPVAQPCADGSERWIQGEVYHVDEKTLQRLDALEGHPRAYRRTPIVLRSGAIAEIYYWPHGIFANMQPEPTGEWNPRGEWR